MEPKWKGTIVVLIPKCTPATKPEHFRPISLCTSIYKVTAKILANRMKPLLNKNISIEQTAFVPGRLLSDNCILTQELLHRMNTTESRAGYMAIKVDMEKAFDRMQWGFVRRAMEAFGFPARWIQLVLEWISSPRFGLLINGVKSNWISATCDLRQGCPMSPYLCILCSEFLSLLIHQSSHPGLGIKVCNSSPKISHLLFADDTILFGAATVSTATEFVKILQLNCGFSGEAVNASKSNIIFGPKVPAEAKDSILSFLGHQDVKSFKYLGIKMRIGKIRISDYKSILDKIAGKIRSWGSRHLSMAGRVALINSTLSAIHMHNIENSPVPMSIINKINGLLSQFLWSGSLGKHSIHFTSWNDICTPKVLGRAWY